MFIVLYERQSEFSQIQPTSSPRGPLLIARPAAPLHRLASQAAHVSSLLLKYAAETKHIKHSVLNFHYQMQRAHFRSGFHPVTHDASQRGLFFISII